MTPEKIKLAVKWSFQLTLLLNIAQKLTGMVKVDLRALIAFDFADIREEISRLSLLSKRQFLYAVVGTVIFSFVTNTASATGFWEMRFVPATQEDFNEVSQICDYYFEKSHQDEIARMQYHSFYRAKNICMAGIRGNYCYTLVYNSTSKQCKMAFYTKLNGLGTELFSKQSGAVLSFNATNDPDYYYPVISFETAGGSIALIEYSNHLELMNIESNPHIGAR